MNNYYSSSVALPHKVFLIGVPFMSLEMNQLQDKEKKDKETEEVSTSENQL